MHQRQTLEALTAGLYLIFSNANDPIIWILLAAGAFFVLFYTWPLKGLGLGEVAVLVVWGPLMIGGGWRMIRWYTTPAMICPPVTSS